MEARSTQQETTTTRSRATDGANGASNSSPQESRDTLSKDLTFQILSAERRRRVLRYLETEAETTLGKLAEHIAAIENDKPERALTSAERKRVYIALYQCHLPKMDDADAIDFEKHRGTVTRGVHADRLGRYLASSEEPTVPPGLGRTPLSVIGLGLGSLGVLAALHGDPLFSGVVIGLLLALLATLAVRTRN